MSLPNYLSKIKSAGIYRFVFDKSEVPGEETETMRLVVGYSEKGPFNTLVYVESISEFETIFGGVNKKLERRGCYFHRLAEQALGVAPILVLNLKPFDTDTEHPELVGASSFNVDETVNEKLKTLGIQDIYDTTRFWYLEPEGLGKVFAEKNDPQHVQKYITMTATDSVETTKSVFFRGYQPTGYDVSFKEWYASVLNGEEIPSYLEGHEMDKLSEYFAEVFVFSGKFTPEIATSEALAKYFDVTTVETDNTVTQHVALKPYITNAFGEKKDTLVALASDPNSGFVTSYSGILLPNFKSPNGSYISLDLLFNSDQDIHKMMMNLNIDALYDGDISIDDINTTGWQAVGDALKVEPVLGGVTLRAMSIEGVKPVYVTAEYTRGGWEYHTPEGSPETYAEPDFYEFSIDNCTVTNEGYSLRARTEITEIGTVGDKFIVNPFDSDDTNVAVLTKVDTVSVDTPVTRDMPSAGAGTFNVETDYQPNDRESYTTLHPGFAQCAFAVTGVPESGETPTVIAIDVNLTSSTSTVPVLSSDNAKMSLVQQTGENETYTIDGALTPGSTAGTGKFTFTATGSIESFERDTIYHIVTEFVGEEFEGLTCQISATDLSTDKWDELSTVDVVSSVPVSSLSIVDALVDTDTFGELTFDRRIDSSDPLYGGALIRCNHPVYATCQNLTPTAFDGYTYALSLPTSDMMSKLNWQNEILNTLTKYDGIRLALTNRKDSEYHYLVDTFESYVASELKSTFGVIAKEKDNCLALVNFPAMSTFKNCKYTSFTDSTGKFQTKYIADGCNKQKPAAVLFSLMSEFNGASFVSYNTPVVLSDGTIKTICPSAALVSNDFMAKYDTRFPYSIVAGPTYGRIIATGLQGPDFNFSRADLDILEPMGVNCMVYVPRKGTYINSNQTAKQNPVTALSKINVRELVIYLQDEIESLLQSYSWEFNTQELRDTIKSKADTICETVKLNGGLYEYLNVCDESNNTPDVIDNEMLILDTSIEPGRGAGKMVQRLYIYKTGGLKALMS